MTSSDCWSQIFEEKLAIRILATWVQIGPKARLFSRFLKFDSLLFLKIAYNDSLQQCLTPNRGKIHGKRNLGGEGGGPKYAQRSQNWAKTRFFVIFSSLVL